MHALDLTALLLRVIVAITMLAHGWNHAFGGGRIPGTARWFASIGMRPPLLHAYAATVTELGARDTSTCS
jgi:putative oxidoreductase